MSKGTPRDERRLRRIFERALCVALAAPIFVPFACGTAKEASTGSAGSAGQTGTGGSGGHAGSAGNAGAMSTGSAGDGGEAGDAGAEADALDECAPREYIPDPVDTCGNYMRLPCGLPSGVIPSGDCFLLLNDCKGICPGPYFNCRAVEDSCVDGGVVIDPDGGVSIDCSTCPGGVGRFPAGLLRPRGSRRGARCVEAGAALGDYFAAASHLEAASVHAFRRLRAELTAHGAPARLSRAASRALRDEVRHARVTARLARRFGSAPPPVEIAAVAPRSLEDIAIENAVEGCVRETFGALVATFQARTARDPDIARSMRVIAADETRHAALSWAVSRWALRRLDAGARGRMAARCRAALEALRREAAAPVAAELMEQAGLPSPEQRLAMLGALERSLWVD